MRPQARRRPRRPGGATKDAQRRALAKANARPGRPVPAAPPQFAVLHCDGGARGAPGAAAIGYVIDDDAGRRVAEHGEAIGLATAAEAEYRALLAGLLHARGLGLTRIVARSDSRLLIAHVNGERLPRDPELRELGTHVAAACEGTDAVIFEWVPAAANGAAHRLVAQVLGPGR